MLQNEYLVANIGFDSAENEPFKALYVVFRISDRREGRVFKKKKKKVECHGVGERAPAVTCARGLATRPVCRPRACGPPPEVANATALPCSADRCVTALVAPSWLESSALRW